LVVEAVGVAVSAVDQNTFTVDAVEFVLDTYTTAGIVFEYYSATAETVPAQNGTADQVANATASAFAFFIEFFVLFEYDEQNNVPGYQPGSSDILTGFYNLTAVPPSHWQAISCSSLSLTDSNGNSYEVWTCASCTSDNVFCLAFTVAGRDVSVNGTDINPDTMKIDFEIQWFNNSAHVPTAWGSGPSNVAEFPYAQVGIYCVFAAEIAAEVTKTSDGGNPSYQFASGDFTGFFSWESNADVMGVGEDTFSTGIVIDQETDVNGQDTTAAADWVVKLIIFCFDKVRPQAIIWDPEFGANIDYSSIDGTTTSGSSSLSIPLSFALLAALAALIRF